MTFAIGVTDLDWFATLKRESLGSEINFWTPTPWNVTRLARGEPWYFMLKSPVRKIGGFGLFREYHDMRTSEAWHRYGIANGVFGHDELVKRIQKYTEKRSNQHVTDNDPEIGCIILSDPVLFDETDFFAPEDYGLDFARQIVKYKTFEGRGIPHTLRALNAQPRFQLVSAKPSERKHVPVKDRKGQPAFRQKVLAAYGSRCAVTATRITEVLQAAHIQPYINETSNHVQNGLCLRADVHALFDEGLIAVDSDYSLIVSERIAEASKAYRRLRGRQLRLPRDPNSHPSKAAIEYHRVNVFVG